MVNLPHNSCRVGCLLPPPTPRCEWAEPREEIPVGLIHRQTVTAAPGPLLNPATCLMMTAAHSPVDNGVTSCWFCAGSHEQHVLLCKD